MLEEFSIKKAAELFPKRPTDAHKGMFGRAVLLGGSVEYSGAAKLAAMASGALRCGSGLCTLAVPQEIVHGVLPYVLENTVAPMPSEEGHLVFERNAYSALLSKADSLAIGMGMGLHKENADILRFVLGNYSGWLILDADALNTLAQDLSLLQGAKPRIIITPHLMEFSRLTKLPISEISANPAECAADFAKAMGITVLLKGSTTYISDGAETVFVTRGTPGMSKGGSGDVLSGILAGLSAFVKGSSVQIAATGATIAGIAGELTAEKLGEYSMLASDEVSAIPAAIQYILCH